MADVDPAGTERDLADPVVSELEAEGFDNAREVGRGGFGSVYRCVQTSLDRTVAIKVLDGVEGDDRERFVREQRAMGRLSGHPNIVQILQVGVLTGGRPYIVMPYHARDSLETWVRDHGPLPWPDAFFVGIKLAGALQTAHDLGILHRDVKPANILITDYGEPQLADFGIARVGGAFKSSTGNVAGSPAYTAPELLHGQPPGPASDIYSLGSTLFTLITGHAAFERRAGEGLVAQFIRITSASVPDLRLQDFPPDVVTAVEHAMTKTPTDRPATATALGEELRAVREMHGSAGAAMVLSSLAESGAHAGTPTGQSSDAGVRRHSMGSTPPSAATKFRPPTSNRPLVGRRRLLDTLRSGGRRRLVLIHAPAGFGKSTLAAQWRGELEATEVSVAWLSVDHDDNNVVWFLAHLVEAVRLVRPALAHELGQILEDHPPDAARYVLSSLADEIHDSGERLALVVDDWHRVSAGETIRAMEFLLDNGCHHLQLVVTSRSQAGLPLSRMRVRDELVEIGPDAMRFDAAEAKAFLLDVNALPLNESEVADLVDSTDGWAAALQLASLSLRGRDDPAEFIRHLSGRHHAIGEYLVDNVLCTLEPDLIDFMMCTTITAKVCGDLATQLSGAASGQALLEEIEGRDLFLTSIDDDKEWFRYHHLFAEFLQRRLERNDPARIRELHLVASRWFGDHGMLSEAVDHAMAAQDHDRAIELVESDGMKLIENSRMATLLGLVAKLPSADVYQRPRLQLIVAWANVLLHRPVAMQSALDRLQATIDAVPATPSERRALGGEANLVRAVELAFSDRTEGAEELVDDLLQRPDDVRPFVASGASDVAAFLAVQSFDFAAARRWQSWAGKYHEQTAGPFSVMYGHCMAGIAAYEVLDVAEAEESFRTALSLARRTGLHSHAARLAGALLGSLLYDKGDVDTAEEFLDHANELGAEGGVVDMMLATYGVGSRIKVLRGDLHAAASRLDEGATAAARLHLRRLDKCISNERIRAGLPLDPATKARLRHADPREPAQDGITEVCSQYDEDSTIRLLLADDSDTAIKEALARSRAMVARVAEQGRPRALLAWKGLEVCCLAAAGRSDEAQWSIASVVSRCASLRLPRILLDAGVQIPDVLSMLLTAVHSGAPWLQQWPNVTVPFLVDLLEEVRAPRGGSEPGSA
ncbi:serine/threonine-protein kinase [Rhodococcus opacus]|uniref:serine/threonine-protein kinase n=1 Tax=Rhodococcus opacus TaxID=37919 RepID=UPI000EAA002F|nr:serine/threonine-protein kinase [Rhodococcus opacus]QZS52631.1 protein kinase [Rhodococcus opacus]RKM64829.1 protein kinase [Rhodococcus opacus]